MSDAPEANTEPQFEYPGTIRGAPDGHIRAYLPIPEHIAASLSDAGIRRVAGRLDEHDFRRSLQPAPDGGHCLRFGKRWMRDAGLEIGSEVWVELNAESDDTVIVPPELKAALAEMPAAAAKWNALSPGRRRGWSHHVERAKRPATREKRARAVLEGLLADAPD